MRELVQKKLAEHKAQLDRLIQTKEQLFAELNAVSGAVQVLEALLAEADAHPIPPVEPVQ